MATSDRLRKLRLDTGSGHNALYIAARLIRMGVEQDVPRNPLQIIKLTYLCHGWMLGLYERPLSGQHVEAWRYGPVIPDVYHAIKRYGSQPITGSPLPDRGRFDGVEADLIQQVFSAYGEFTGIELSQMTHAEGTPWHQTWDGRRNAVIPNDLIQRHFAELADPDA